jgi:hypothetical protein
VRSLTAAAALVILMTLSGCSSGNENAVTQAAEQLHASLRSNDGAAACDLLSDDVRQELAESQGSSCATAVVEAGLPDSGRVADVKVYGTSAQVRYDDDEDVVFLGEFPDGWKVTAAGCSAEADAPYDCQVQGG